MSSEAFLIYDAENLYSKQRPKNIVVKHPTMRLMPIRKTFNMLLFLNTILYVIDYIFKDQLSIYFIEAFLKVYQFIQTLYSKKIVKLQFRSYYIQPFGFRKVFQVINKAFKYLRMESQTTQNKAQRSVKSLFTQIHKFYVNQDSQKLSNILKELYFGSEYQNLSFENWNTNIKISAEYDTSSDNVTSNFVKILENIKKYEISVKSKQWQAAFDLHLKILVGCVQILKFVKQNEYTWILKTIRTIIRATKKIFMQSMNHILNSSKIINDLVNTLNSIKTNRSISQQTLAEISPLIDNMQISIFFNFHNYEMIGMIMKGSRLETASDNKFLGNYLFLKGKLALINQNFKEAERLFQSIKIKTVGQKRLVLKYLIPCKMFLGLTFSSKRTQERFPEYEELAKALKTSSFKNLQFIIEKYQKIWIKRGIYLLMDRFRIIIWRNLMKKICHVVGDKIGFDQISKAVRLAGGEETMGQCIMIVANLLDQKYIKGYIYQNEKMRALVLKKEEGFPKLSELIRK